MLLLCSCCCGCCCCSCCCWCFSCEDFVVVAVADVLFLWYCHNVAYLKLFSFHGAVNNYLIPGGIDTFADIREDLNQYYNGYFWWGAPAKNIQCWLGDWIYILGVFGILALGLVFYQSSNGSRADNYFLISLALLLLVAVAPSFPLIPMIFASGIYNIRKRE